MSDLTILNQSLTQSAISGQLFYMPTGRITSSINMYVRRGGADNHSLTDCQTNDDSHALASLSGAFTLLSKYTIDDNCLVTVNVNSGVFYCNSTIYLNHKDGSKISVIGYTSASTATDMTSANTTTFNWTGTTTVDGLRIEGANLALLKNFYLVGGTSGTKSTRNGIYLNQSATLTLLTTVRSEYWNAGISINNRSNSALSGSIYCNSNTTQNIAISNNSMIQHSASSLTLNSSTYGVSIANLSQWYSNSSSNPITMSNCASGILVNSNSFGRLYNVYAVDNNGYGITSQNNSSVNVTSAIIKSYGSNGGLYANTDSYLTCISGSLSGVNCLYSINNSYILVLNMTLSASSNALYAAYNSYLQGATNTIVSGAISPAYNVIGNFNSYTLST